MLNIGDTIGIIALSGECEREKVENSKAFFENLGYNVELSKNIYDRNRYLAGDDNDKISELHRFFMDNKIKLILCARGGYGAIRLINKINYEIIKSNPKPFCGFSDVTALLLMIYKKTGITTYHSPMACSDFGNTEVNKFTEKNFFKALNNMKLKFTGTHIYKEGNASGKIWGGNLATIASLCGQDFIPEEDFIFFAEDINEPVYKIDRMFQQIINTKPFKRYCKGIILGEFIGCDNPAWLGEYFKEICETMNIPTIGGFKISHASEKITLPIGKMANINKNILSIL